MAISDDVVTHVPGLGYATLPNATVLQPASAQAGIRLDIFCNITSSEGGGQMQALQLLRDD